MTVFNDTFDKAAPDGGDDPAEADNNMRRIQAAVQERENVDHYWPLTGTEVSDVDTGEHRKVTLRVASAPTAVADKGFVYAKEVGGKAELFYRDEDGNEVQLTSAGNILSASLDMKDEDDLASDSATHAATQQSIKAYADAILAALDAAKQDLITKYDSGWFAISKNVLYTKAHGLGAIPTIAQVWFSDTSDGTGDVVSITGPNSDGNDRHCCIVDLDATNVKIRGDLTIVDYEDDAGTRHVVVSGFAKIIAILIP